MRRRFIDTRIFKSFFSLSAVQVINSAIPLLVTPYVIRQVGVERFGHVALAQTIVLLLTAVTDYGFYFSATRDISRVRDDTRALGGIVSTVLTAKALLCGGCLLLMTGVVLVVPDFRAEYPLYLLSAPLLLGQAFLPVWFFHGVERMRTLVFLNLFGKVIFVALIPLVNQPDDYVYVNFFQGVGSLLAVVPALAIIHRRHRVRLRLSSLRAVRRELVDNALLFASSFSVYASAHTPLIVLSFFAGDYLVGIYSVAEKVYFILRTLVAMVHQAVYPKACQLAQTSVAPLMGFFRRLMKPVAAGYLLGYGLLFVMADDVVRFFAGKAFPTSADLLRALALAPFCLLLSMPGSHTLLAFDLKQTYARVMVAGALFSLGAGLLAIPAFRAWGTVWVVVTTEALTMLLTYVLLGRRHKAYFATRQLFRP
ncbi:MAG: oligosaccharide flippase family protein [Catalinimonas sp.]